MLAKTWKLPSLKKNHQKEEHVKREQKIKRIADLMCQLLIENGFVVQRYDAYSTNSIYLKLDYGLCNSIRISDHKGKDHLSYKYNLRSDIKKYYKERDKYVRYYYPFEERKRLIEHIKCDKRAKIYRLGSIEEYRDIMQIEKNLKTDNKGFWQKAYLVS